MTRSETLAITDVGALLAENGYDMTPLGPDVLQLRDPDTGVGIQAALEGNVLYMSVNLTTVPSSALTADALRRMLSADNDIATSSFRLYDAGDGKTTVALNNFCTLQNMGEEDKDDVLSLAGYLMADLIQARGLLEPLMPATAQ